MYISYGILGPLQDVSTVLRSLVLLIGVLDLRLPTDASSVGLLDL